jgi:transcription elongation GreA/GreB family factor
MSRAFVKEKEDFTSDLPDRPLSVHPNFVTPDGLAAIERAINRFEAGHAAAVAKDNSAAIYANERELRYWRARRATARVIQPSADKSRVHFGSTVTIRRDDGREQTFRIVGEDEADPHKGTVSHVSPLSRAVIGKSVGEAVEIVGGETKVLKIE